MTDKELFLKKIEDNIREHGFHLTIVNSNTEPRYVYSIGLNSILGFELMFAGGIIFLKNDIDKIFNVIASQLKSVISLHKSTIKVEKLGSFALKEMDSSWSSQMTLGIFDYYQSDRVKVFQIIPDRFHLTKDVPDMSSNMGLTMQPVWKWLTKEWDLNVPESATVTTNIDALKGERITEVTRWEVDEWEMFAGSGPDTPKDELRVVPLSTLLGIDSTLEDALQLPLEGGIWRNEDELSQWNVWE